MQPTIGSASNFVNVLFAARRLQEAQEPIAPPGIGSRSPGDQSVIGKGTLSSRLPKHHRRSKEALSGSRFGRQGSALLWIAEHNSHEAYTAHNIVQRDAYSMNPCQIAPDHLRQEALGAVDAHGRRPPCKQSRIHRANGLVQYYGGGPALWRRFEVGHKQAADYLLYERTAGIGGPFSPNESGNPLQFIRPL